MNWEAKIEKVENGYILWIPDMDNEDENRQNKVYVYGDEENDESQFATMVWALAEHFAEVGSKHDPKRFWVGMIEKDKYP